MRDIVHPYIGLGGVPVRETGAAAKDRHETQEMERIRAEILRLGTVSGPEPDWRVVVDCAVIVLRDQRKDLQVACYLAWGLFEREGYTGLAVGLTIVKDMTALYWDSLHPPADRPKARLAALDWLAENLSARVDRRLPSPGDGAALERALSVLVDLEEDQRRHHGHKAPPFGHVRRQVAEYLGRLPGPKPAAPAAAETTPPPSPPPAAPVAERPAPSPAPAPADPAPAVAVRVETPPPAAPPSKPRLAGRILTPAERARRRARWVAAAAIVLLLVGLSGAGAAYWVLEVKRVDDVAAHLTAPDRAAREAGLAALAALPDRQRAALLRAQADAVLDHYLTLATAEADRYAFLSAEAYLAEARALYPDSARVMAAALDLERRRSDLAADVRRRLDDAEGRLLAHLEAALPAPRLPEARDLLRRFKSRVEQGDLRNARVDMDRLAALLPAADATVTALLPRLTALAFLDLAERQADRQYYTRSLQVLADGLTLLPGEPMLLTARDRYLAGRSEFLLRNVVTEPDSLESLLVREAADHLRTAAPARFQAVTAELRHPVADTLARLETAQPDRAATLRGLAAGIFGVDAGS